MNTKKQGVVYGDLTGLPHMLNTVFSVAGITLLTVLLPILISYLLDEKSLPSADRISRKIHEETLSHLMKVGPQYPAHFRVIMTSQVELKMRLEAAIKYNQETKNAMLKAQEKAKIAAQPAKPTITLKTNFGSFA